MQDFVMDANGEDIGIGDAVYWAGNIYHVLEIESDISGEWVRMAHKDGKVVWQRAKEVESMTI